MALIVNGQQVNLDITATNNASPVIKQVAADVGGLATSTDSLSESSGEGEGAFGSLLNKITFAVDPLALASKGFQFLMDMVVASAQEFAQAEYVITQLDAVLKSTGGAAGVTKDELLELADGLEKMSGVEGELIIKGEALLLTFTKIGKEVFPDAIEAALNMSMAMGTDLQSSIIQVGKALNEPIEGVSALRRVGVQLTDQQEEQIRAFMDVNDVASAQKIILGELETQFGGVAKAMGDTTVGSVNRLKNAWGELLEVQGESRAVIWRETNEGLIETIELQTRLIEVQNNLVASGEAENITSYQQLRARAYSIAMLELEREQYEEVYSARMNGLASIYETTTATQGLANATSDFVEIDKEAVQGAIKVKETYDKQNEKLSDLQVSHAELTAKKQDLLNQGYWPEHDAILKLNDKLADNEQKQKDVTEAMKGTLDQMLLNTAAAGLDAEGQLALARATGQIDEAAFEAISAQMLLKKEYEDGRLSAEKYAEKTIALKDAVARLESKGIRITVDAIFNEMRTIVTRYTTGHEQTFAGGYAKGTDGWETVPSGYPNDTYPILLTSGERFAVIPQGVTAAPALAGGMGGGMNYIHITYAPGMSFGDENAAMNNLKSTFLALLEEAKADGQVD